MLTIRRLSWIGACLLGAGIVAIIGATCLYASSRGGPQWMVGREISIFLKLSALTAVAVVIDIAWRAFALADSALELKTHDHEMTPSENVEVSGGRIPGERSRQTFIRRDRPVLQVGEVPRARVK